MFRALNAALDRAAKAEEATRAWKARFWQVHTGGSLVPSDEDAALFDALIGPMPPPFRNDEAH